MKKIKFIVIILLMMVIFIVPVMAETNWSGTYPPIEVTEGYDYHLIMYRPNKEGYNQDSTIQYVAAKAPMYVLNGKIYSTTSGGLKLYYWSGTVWGNLSTISSEQLTSWHEDSRILYSNYDIYTDSTLQDVFFSDTHPIPMPPIQETLTQHPPLSLMNPQIRGIVPYLIGLIIASVAFYKGFQFLSRILRKA